MDRIVSTKCSQALFLRDEEVEGQPTLKYFLTMRLSRWFKLAYTNSAKKLEIGELAKGILLQSTTFRLKQGHRKQVFETNM